jgi:hypothetical protein
VGGRVIVGRTFVSLAHHVESKLGQKPSNIAYAFIYAGENDRICISMSKFLP